MNNINIIGRVVRLGSDTWVFETQTHQYSNDICCALDELLGSETKDGDEFEIVVRQVK